ncbi:MFS transporter [Vibrio sp. J1-1]|uniref:MFS transporter n=1 Tax=Vibrio sp. J1-1 TaxID=2912251 RepID=UPI001F003C24|nr:MFS transporter [Vibrio sp. J1-1]MBR9873524.1 MFS transporter [Vibrionaceae bacterium]MCF7483882.1 MFS transporter [Vibrio sp. J1-1]
MTILWRSWFAFVTILAVILSTFSLLFCLQFNSTLSELIAHRLSVIAHTTATTFKSVTDLGLPLEMMKNAQAILNHAQENDDTIRDIHAFTPSGKIIYSTTQPTNAVINEHVLQTLRHADHQEWRLETQNTIFSGSSIYNRHDQLVGGIVIDYPKHNFNTNNQQLIIFVLFTSILIFCSFAIVSFVIFKLILSKAIKGMRYLDTISKILHSDRSRRPFSRRYVNHKKENFGLLAPIISSLDDQIERANAHFNSTKIALTAHKQTRKNAQPFRSVSCVFPQKEGDPVVDDSNLSETFAKKLLPLIALLLILAVALLGTLSVRYMSQFIEPEIVNRTQLIGKIVNSDIQRAVNAGIPISKITGAEEYLSALIQDFKEVSYIGIFSNGNAIESGNKESSSFSTTNISQNDLQYIINSADRSVGKIIIDIDSDFIRKQFNEVYLDIIVIIIVTTMITFESMVVMIWRTVTSPIMKLHTLASQQAMGDFSKFVISKSNNSFGHIMDVLSQRSFELYRLSRQRAVSPPPANRYHLSTLHHGQNQYHTEQTKPQLLTFSHLNDIRWPLFLFIAADELPLSFFPLFTRAAENPWDWLDQSIIISLPLVGYLIAIFICSPISKRLTLMLGHRKLLLWAMVPAVFIQIGLYFSTSVTEIIFFRTLSGFGYAIATLTYQDYVIDMISPQRRTQSLGNFTAVLVGGIFCGTATGAILADRLGQHSVFLISSVLVALACLLITLLLPANTASTVNRQHQEFKLSSIVRLLTNKRFFSFVVGIAMPCNVIMQAFVAFIVALYMNQLGASTAETGRTLMGYFLMTYFVAPVSTKYSEHKVSPTNITIIGATVTGIALLLAGIATTQQEFLLAVLGVGLGHGLVRSHQLPVLVQLTESSLAKISQYVVLGATRTIERGGSIFGLLVAAWLSGAVGYPRTIILLGTLSLCGVLLFSLTHLIEKPIHNGD